MGEPISEAQIAAVRRFNRLYTQKIGVLEEGLLHSPYSLTEARVLYELAHRDRPSAADLCRDLGLDQGYLSRILTRFRKKGLVEQSPSDTDGRRRCLGLTEGGRATFETLDAASAEQVAGLLAPLPAAARDKLTRAITAVEEVLAPPSRPTAPYILRPPRAGDMGRVVQAHGELYTSEYGWDETFEGFVAGIIADFVKSRDPRRDRCWIAERNGDMVGSVFLVRQSKTEAKLRMLYVAAEARGLGIGARLVDEAIRFARQTGCATVTLWTNDILTAARHIYEAAGFRLVREEPHHSFGEDLIGQYWALDLDAPATAI